MISGASCTIVQHSSMESASDRKSSTYIVSCSSSTARDAGNEAKWDWTVAFKRKGRLQFPNKIHLNLMVLMSPSAPQKKKNDIHFGLPYTLLSGEKLSQYLQWWQTASIGTEAKSQSDSPTNLARLPYNHSKRWQCNRFVKYYSDLGCHRLMWHVKGMGGNVLPRLRDLFNNIIVPHLLIGSIIPVFQIGIPIQPLTQLLQPGMSQLLIVELTVEKSFQGSKTSYLY